MLFYLIILFVCLPLAELALLFRVHEWVGFGPTLALVILTGLVGASLARWQGLRVLSAIRRDLAMGQMPAPHLLDGLLILLAGAFLVTPGLITDTAGFCLLIPPARSGIKRWLRGRLEGWISEGSVRVVHWGD